MNPENEIIQRNHYYSFGMRVDAPHFMMTGDPRGDYLYNGKELQEELGLNWLSFGFREYDPAIGRFTGVDPIADQYSFVSGFNYAENDPVRYIDLWGLQKELNIIKTGNGANGTFQISENHLTSKDHNNHPDFILYSDKEKYGDYGTLTVYVNVDSGDKQITYTKTVGERIADMFDGESKGGAEITSDLKTGDQIGSINENTSAEYIDAYPQGIKWQEAGKVLFGDGGFYTIPGYYNHLENGAISSIISGYEYTGEVHQVFISEQGDSLTSIRYDSNGNPIDTVTHVPKKENRGILSTSHANYVEKIDGHVVTQKKE